MQCIIHSKVRQTINLWKQLVDFKSQCMYDISSLLNDVSKISLEQINQGHGLLLDVEGYKCVVTCSHIVGKANMRIDISLQTFDNLVITEECKIIANIEEYEISILEFVNKKNMKLYNFCKTSELQNFRLNVESHHKIKYFSMEGVLNTTLMVNEIDINNIYVENVHIKSKIVPKLPLLCVESRYLPIDVHGLSGATIVNNEDMPIGLISNSIDCREKLYCLPISVIIKFIKELKKNSMQKFSPSSVIFDYDLESAELENSHITCCVIKNTFNVGYKSTGKKNFKFEMGDAIYKLNNVSLNNDGSIYHSELDLNVDIRTFFMIESMFGKFVRIDMYRLNDQGEYCKFNCSISGTRIESISNTTIINNNKYFVWNNHVFTEVSDELLMEFINGGFLNINFIEKNKTLKENNTKMVLMFDGNTLKIVEKIGNKNITGLGDIQTYLKLKKNNLTCKTATEIEKYVI